MRHLLASLRALLASPAQLDSQLRRLGGTVADIERGARQDAKRNETEAQELRAEMTALRGEVHDRLLQYHLQLGRLATLVEGNGGEPALGSHRPLRVARKRTRANGDADAAAAAAGSDQVSASGSAAVDAADQWLELPACPACGTVERTIACEWNKLVLLDAITEQQAWRYDYAVCHGCGILYATRRPVGARYQYLLDNFEDVIDKDAGNPLLNPYPLSEADRERYRQLIARGVFVSDHEGGPHLRGVLSDRLENAAHVDLLGSLLDLRGARVLEIRPRAGSILEGLRRHYDADVHAMPIFESQQFIMRELYGIPTSSLIDYDRFSIPFEGSFDLIICNHMFNHAVRLDEFFATLRAALRPNGHLYLYNEIDDSEFLAGGQSMIATMNPLHLQAADVASLARAVAATGFAPTFVKGHKRRNLALMRKAEPGTWTRISDDDREARVAAYRRARDRAVLRAPEHVRSRFADVWSGTVERAVAAGLARFDHEGVLRLVKDA